MNSAKNIPKEFQDKFDAVVKNPSVSNVLELQRYVNVGNALVGDAKDDKRQLDGILGPITTAEILKKINSCSAAAASETNEDETTTEVETTEVIE